MKATESNVLGPELALQARRLGEALAHLRTARGVKPDLAALHAGLSLNTAKRLEKGDPGVAIGQMLRYLDAIAPRKTLLELLAELNPAWVALVTKKRRKRVRDSTESHEVDF